MNFGMPVVGSLWINAYSGLCVIVAIDEGIVRYRYFDNWWRQTEMYDYNFLMYFKPVTKDENR